VAGIGVLGASIPREGAACVFPRPDLDRHVAAGILVRVGITPASIAASGLTAEDVGPLVTRTLSHLEGAAWALASADDLCRTRDEEVRRLERLFKTGTARPDDREALALARSEARQATLDRSQILNGIFDAAVDGVAAGTVETLRTLRANFGQRLETELLVVNRTPEEWSRIRYAVTVCRACEGRTPPSEQAQLLATVRADPAVVAAREHLVALPSVRQAWAQAITPR
jgi:hypothetical protein